MHEVRKPRVWCHTEEYAFSFDDAITTSTSSASPFETIQLKKRDSILDTSKILTIGKYPRYDLVVSFQYLEDSLENFKRFENVRRSTIIDIEAIFTTMCGSVTSRDRERNNTIANYLAIR